MRTFDEAQELLRNLPIKARQETLALADGLGRVLAREVTALNDQPPFDRATMDGYAVCLADQQNTFDVIGTVLAGQEFDGIVPPGQAVRIMTGAPCPKGCTVVPIERTDGGESSVTIEDAALLPEKNVAWRGQDAHSGQLVLNPGTWLAPQTMSSAAMAGATEISCYVPPKVGIVTTGDEVGAVGPASVRNSNGPLLAAFCSSLNVANRSWHALDESAQLRATLEEASEASDVVVTVGGVSMGSADLVPGTAQNLGFQQVLHKVAMQPGKPVFLAQRPDGTVFLGLPGNPVSVLVTAHLFLAPLIGRYLGDWSQRWFDLPLQADYTHKGTRRLFLPAKRTARGVLPVRWNGSGDFYAAARGDGLVDLQPQGVWRAGDRLRFLPFLGHRSGSVGQ